MNLSNTNFTRLISLVLIVNLFSACEENEPANLEAPVITFQSDAVKTKPGETAKIQLTYNAPAGIKTLVYTVDGGDQNEATITDGSTNGTIEISHEVPVEDAEGKSTWGTVYTFDFTITDKQSTAKSGTANATVTAEFTPDNKIEVPATYAFLRDGSTTVSFSGQTDRLNQLSELKAMMEKANAGEKVDAQALLAMYANTGDNGGGNFTFSSTKQLKNKTFISEVEKIENLLNELATNSDNPGDASSGKAGLLTRSGKGKTILVDANGREYVQLVEKGLMGSVFLNQIYNTYLTDDRTGDDVQNIKLAEGKNYTSMEHHWDEAFGYFGVPVDFPTTTTDRFWGNYSNGRNAILGTNKILMDAYMIGRTAIVNFDYAEKEAQKEVLFENLELLAASTAIHYINSTLSNVGTDQGEMHHALSEAYAFIEALKYSPNRKMELEEINTILGTDIGENFYDVTLTGLKSAKDKISAKYGLDADKDNL